METVETRVAADVLGGLPDWADNPKSFFASYYTKNALYDGLDLLTGQSIVAKIIESSVHHDPAQALDELLQIVRHLLCRSSCSRGPQ